MSASKARYALALVLFVLGTQVFAPRADAQVHAVLISHRVTNRGDATARAVTAVCILPASNRYQQVMGIEIDPPPSRRVKTPSINR